MSGLCTTGGTARAMSGCLRASEQPSLTILAMSAFGVGLEGAHSAIQTHRCSCGCLSCACSTGLADTLPLLCIVVSGCTLHTCGGTHVCLEMPNGAVEAGATCHVWLGGANITHITMSGTLHCAEQARSASCTTGGCNCVLMIAHTA